MLIKQPTYKIVQRICQNNEGVLVRVHILVALYEGKLYTSILKTEALLDKEISSKEVVCALPAPVESPKEYHAYLSPFTNFLFKKDFAFITAQPTRAPSLNSY